MKPATAVAVASDTMRAATWARSEAARDRRHLTAVLDELLASIGDGASSEVVRLRAMVRFYQRRCRASEEREHDALVRATRALIGLATGGDSSTDGAPESV